MSNEFVARNGLIALDSSQITGSLTVTGSMNVIGPITGSNILTAGTITAQTLIVQTITSSVDFVTGSTRFGSLLTNIHQFTGSVNMTSSLVVEGIFQNTLSGNSSYGLIVSSSGNGDTSIQKIGASSNLLITAPQHILINPTSNVGIGGGQTVPKAKLAIVGTDDAIVGLGNSGTKFGIFNGTPNGNYGLLVGVLGTGNTFFQVQRVDSTATAYDLIFQPSGGNIGVATTSPGARLDVSGSGRFTNGLTVTGSLSTTGNITTAGTITAQTLVVQTVTSSVSLITGSTQFGSLLANTHQFTGSVSITGSLNVGGLSTFRNAVTVNYGTTNRTTQITDQGFYISRISDGSYVGSITGDGHMTFSTRNYYSFISNAVELAKFDTTSGFSTSLGVGTLSPVGYHGYDGAGTRLEIRDTTNNLVSAHWRISAQSGSIGLQNNRWDFRSSNAVQFTQGGVDNLYLATTGRVGIGTNSPDTFLHITSTAATASSITLNAGGTGNSSVRHNRGGVFKFEVGPGGGSDDYLVYNGASNAYSFRIKSDAGGNVILNETTGSVGIGTTSPIFRLDVSGSGRFTSGLTVTGSFTVITGSAIELQVTDTGIVLGSAVTDTHRVTGSLNASTITGSLFGTASWAQNAITASFALTSAGGGAATATTFNRVTASYTFVLADAGKTVEVSGSTATTYNLTVPAASTTNFADGTFIDVVLYGTGSIQFVTASGVTFRSANNWTKLGTRYGAATLINIAGDEWYLIGNLNA